MENNFSEIVEDVELIDDDYDYYTEDPVLDIVFNRPTDLYSLSVGQTSVDKNFEDLTTFIQSHSWNNTPEKEEFDYKQYSDYLEYVLYALLSDFNQASQLLAGLLSMIDKTRGIDPATEIYTKHPVRKAFAHYVFGSEGSSNDLFRLSSEYEFNTIIDYYDNAPIHIKTSLADYLEKVTPTVYNTPS